MITGSKSRQLDLDLSALAPTSHPTTIGPIPPQPWQSTRYSTCPYTSTLEDPASIAEAHESHAASVLAVADGDDEIPDRYRPHPFAGLTRVIRNLEVPAGRFHRLQIHEHLVLREGDSVAGCAVCVGISRLPVARRPTRSRFGCGLRPGRRRARHRYPQRHGCFRAGLSHRASATHPGGSRARPMLGLRAETIRLPAGGRCGRRRTRRWRRLAGGLPAESCSRPPLKANRTPLREALLSRWVLAT